MTQAGLLEHLKLENVSLSHQLTETQQRSIKEKERIAVQLQGIEVRAGSALALFALQHSSRLRNLTDMYM